MYVTRLTKKMSANPDRIVFQYFNPGSPARIKNIIDKVLTLSESESEILLDKLYNDFSQRHLNLKHKLMENFKKVEQYIQNADSLPKEKKYLLGTYFSKEYSIEAASLFNPSIVPHPDQKYLKPGMLRFVMSLRATGEGHMSSIEFRTGILDARNEIYFDTISKYSELPIKDENKNYSKKFLLDRIKAENSDQQKVLNELPEQFNLSQAKKFIGQSHVDCLHENFNDQIINILESNYDINFSEITTLPERVIFPDSPSESVGMEDARFVLFKEEDGSSTYYATYTAYNGKTFGTHLLETNDFLHFRIRTMHGTGIKDKGMALFPRKINGKYVITSRQDGENLYIMYSDNLYFWDEYKLLKLPKEPWEYVQLGNGGSPIETEKGWLLITHAVGAFRRYTLSACLLDLSDPSKVIGTLKYPLIEPNENEREGYVPNVVYSCGSIVHNNELIIPYAMSDSYSGFAKVNLDDLLNNLS